MTKKWIVVNIGCIECRISSNVVGVFTDESKAVRVAEFCDGKYAWREDGQNAFEVFPVPQDEVITAEYDLSDMSEGDRR